MFIILAPIKTKTRVKYCTSSTGMAIKNFLPCLKSCLLFTDARNTGVVIFVCAVVPRISNSWINTLEKLLKISKCLLHCFVKEGRTLTFTHSKDNLGFTKLQI